MKLLFILTLIAISVCTIIAHPAFSQINFLPCRDKVCPPGQKVVQQYDNSCRCVPIDAPTRCDSTVCGAGYKPVLQSNGSCMCFIAECTRADGCLTPPKADTDCQNITGCNPPEIIQP